MRFKNITIFLLFLANIILMFHTVFPHHHHYNQVCLISSHCENDSDAHNHDLTSNEHEHDGNKDSKCCALKQVVAVPPNFLRQHYEIADISLTFDFSNSFFSILFNTSVDLTPEFDIYNARGQTIISSNYINYVNQNTGLRAPPIS
jgi:hypothetical protein